MGMKNYLKFHFTYISQNRGTIEIKRCVFTFLIQGTRRKSSAVKTVVQPLFHIMKWKYIPLSNRVRGSYCTVSYGPSFFPIDLWPARFALEGKKKRESVTYRTDGENEVTKIFIISLLCVWLVRERFLFTRNGFKFLTHLENKTS